MKQESKGGPDFCLSGIFPYIGSFEKIIHPILDLRVVFILEMDCDHWGGEVFSTCCASVLAFTLIS